MPPRPLVSILTVDIGNTATSFAVFRGDPQSPRPRRMLTVSTPGLASPATARRVRGAFLRGPIPPPSTIAVSSVVPRANAPLRRLLKTFGADPLFISHRTPSRVRIRYRNPAEVGADRLVNARAAMALTGKAAIVVDFGTATTFDCVSSRGEYLGGVIAPGPVISAEALFHRTAKLPFTTLSRPARVLGRDTVESIQAGLYHGYRGLVKEILARLNERLRSTAEVLTTGGQARWILNGLDLRHRYIPYLTHLGLYWYVRDQALKTPRNH